MTIYIPGDPVGKQRPRVANGHAYTPEKTRSYENMVSLEWRLNKGPTFDGPIRVRIAAHYAIPARASIANQMKMMRGEILPTKRPDLDNVVKIILDGLNGVAYRDDAQIVTITATKKYAEIPGVFVEVESEGT